MSQSRQLAAIMFTDIVGYTALMGNNEQKALEILNKNRDIHKLFIEQFHGRWIKEIGDGVLASFNTISDAVHAAVHIQEEINKSNDFLLRIGIHQGEVIFEYDDVFGDTVNIASRIQAFAEPGKIYISEAIHNNISNKQDINSRFVKQEILKNVKESIRIYEILNTVSFDAFPMPAPQPILRPLEKSIAVLPFVNMSNDPDQEYFSDGMAEEILNALAQVKKLKVASRTSSFSFKGKNVSVQEIGEKLKVNTVLEGSIRKQGNRLRITAQLINVMDGFHLWSEKFDRNMDDIFAIQDEIAVAITKQLKITLLEEDLELIIKSATSNTDAYELYLKGAFYVSRRGRSVLKGLECFNQAIQLDPGYALAYNGVADAYFIAAFYGAFSGKEVMNKVKSAAETAIHLDDSYCETYCTLAQYYVGLEWNWIEARKNYLKSIERNPNYAPAHAYYGLSILNHIEGDFDKAEKQGRLAIKLEPLGAIYYADLSWILYNAGRNDEAISIAQMGIELDSNSFLCHQIAGLASLKLNLINEAIYVFENLVHISQRHQYAINCLAWALCSQGKFKDAAILLEELMSRSQSEYISYSQMGLTEAWIGNIDKAFECLEKGFNDRDPILITLKHAPHVPSLLKADSRFQHLLQRIGFSK